MALVCIWAVSLSTMKLIPHHLIGQPLTKLYIFSFIHQVSNERLDEEYDFLLTSLILRGCESSKDFLKYPINIPLSNYSSSALFFYFKEPKTQNLCWLCFRPRKRNSWYTPPARFNDIDANDPKHPFFLREFVVDLIEMGNFQFSCMYLWFSSRASST